MLGKKKKIEKATEEPENSNSFFKESKKAIEEKSFLISKYKKANVSISKFFISIIKSLSNFSKCLSLFNQIKDEKPAIKSLESFLDFSNETDHSLKIFNKVLQASDTPEEQDAFCSELGVYLESIENKLTNLINNLLNTKISKNNNQIEKFIDEGLSNEMVEFLNKEIIEENKTLKKDLLAFKNLLDEQFKTTDYKTQIESLKIELENKNKEICDLNQKMDEIKVLNRQIKQKLNASPYLPYIILEGSASINIKSHNCICYFCGFDIITCSQREKEEQMQPLTPNINNINLNITPTEGVKYANLPYSNPNHSEDNFTKLKCSSSEILIQDNHIKDSNNAYNQANSSSLENSNLNLQLNKNINSEKNNFIEANTFNLSLNENCDDVGDKMRQDYNIDILDSTNANVDKRKYTAKDVTSLNNNLVEYPNTISFTQAANKTFSTNEANNQPNTINSPHISTDNENTLNVNNELEEKRNLQTLYRKLYEAYLNLKCEKTYSYQSITKSKPFQMLLSQVENIISLVDLQKQEISLSKKQLNDAFIELKSQEKFLKFEKFKETNMLEEKIENMQKEINILEADKINIQAEIAKNEEMIKTLKNFDYSQLKAIEEYFANKNTNLIEMLKAQAKSSTEKYLKEFEKAESLEKQVLKLSIELDRFKNALSKYENVEGVENLQFEKFDFREREEMKRQIKSYRDKYANSEKNYRTLKSELKQETENSEKLFMEIVLNEKGTEQMNKTIKELTTSLQENNEKIGFLLSEKSKNTETIRNLNDYIEKLELESKDISDLEKEIKNMEENFLKELNIHKDTVRRLENFIQYKNGNIDELFNHITQLTKDNLSLTYTNSDLLKTIENLKTKIAKKITDLEKKCLSLYRSNQKKDINKPNYIFADKKAQDEFELLKLENDIYKKKLQCKICCLRDIDVKINKCNHTFCRECIQNLLNSRQRICPKCRHKITQNDLSDIWID